MISGWIFFLQVKDARRGCMCFSSFFMHDGIAKQPSECAKIINWGWGDDLKLLYQSQFRSKKLINKPSLITFSHQALSERFGERVLCFGNHEDCLGGTRVSHRIHGNDIFTYMNGVFWRQHRQWQGKDVFGSQLIVDDAHQMSEIKFVQDTLQKLVRQPKARGWAQSQRAVPFEGRDSELTMAHHD